MQQFVNFFWGTVRVTLTSEYPERFINVCAQHNIALWDIQRVDTVTLKATMRRDMYPKLAQFQGRGIGDIVVEKQAGVPMFLRRFRKRYALLAGLLITIVGLFALSRYIWEIDVVGNSRVSSTAILRELQDLEVGIGTYKYSIRSDELENQMILKLPELEWLSINVSGSHATVEVREKRPKPDIIPESVPCNVLAAKSGVVQAIDTLAGAPTVTVGQPVAHGQLLVSGLVDSKRIGLRKVHALADIKARIWYEYKAVMPADVIGKRYESRPKHRYALVIGGLRLNFYRNSSQNGVDCDKMVKRTSLRLPPNLTLPVTWVEEQLTPYTPTRLTIPQDVANGYMRNQLGARLHGAVGSGEIIGADYTAQAGDAVWYGTLMAESVEQIALSVPMPE